MRGRWRMNGFLGQNARRGAIMALALTAVLAGCSAMPRGQSIPQDQVGEYSSVSELVGQLEANFGCVGSIANPGVKSYMGKEFTEYSAACMFEPIGNFVVFFYEDSQAFEYFKLEQCVEGKAYGNYNISEKQVRGANWTVYNIEGVTEVSNSMLQSAVGGEIETPFDDCD